MKYCTLKGILTSIGIEPMVGYKIIPRLSVGARLRYIYIRDNRYSPSYTSSTYGGSWFTLFDMLNNKSPYGEWTPFYSVGLGVGF